MSRSSSVEEEYRHRYAHVLVSIAEALERLIRSHLEGVTHVDRITARAKAIDRFVSKARKTDEHGTPKYSSPLSEIQDQLGARIVVFYLDDVQLVADVIGKYFTSIEARDLVPESESEFGYVGRHFVLAVPSDVVPGGVDAADVPRFFELQIKTLFQHAWSEANHDLGYKARSPLTSDQKRRMAFTAAQAWGADRMFGELCRELGA
jgi:ppGpp synthetase/RelA/SpoT-type nucleotidyltranferase